jgi:hypothetical protein
MSYLLGVTTVTSLWFFLHFSGSPIELFGALDQRLLQINYAKTLLPTIILGAIIPALTITAYPEAELSKNLQVIWPVLPFSLSSCIACLPGWYKIARHLIVSTV